MPATLDDVLRVGRLMRPFLGPWWIAGGWAIDVWLGAPSREHGDLEVAVLRRDLDALRRCLDGWTLEKVALGPDGGRWVPLAAAERLEPPEFQLRARRLDGEGERVFEVFLDDDRDGQWVSRRHATVRRPLAAVAVPSPLGLPVLAPEVQLLYKAKYHRPKDEHDFARALPRLSAGQRAWLRGALEEYHPGDPWLAAL